MNAIDNTHNPALRSWVETANEPASDFPVQNLPFGRFKVEDDPEWRIGVAIGDQVLDLRAAGLIHFSDMNRLIRLKPETRRELRAQISAGLAAGSPQQDRWSRHLHPQGAVELGLPCDIRDYTDFYVGIHHATAVGKLFRPDNPLLPNYKWVPIGYHGRASTIQPSGHSFHRPLGQIKGPDTDAPMLAPTKRLDLELELGYVIGRPNAMGHPIPLAEAEDHVFGVTLFNDWSARDFQAWEYQPLGPFLSKNFASTLSPWMVTLEALAPFRQALQRPAGDPPPLPYLRAEASERAGAFDIDLDVLLQTARMRAEGHEPEVISRSNAAQAAYWSLAQLVTHHTVNGCALSAGDLFGSGTLSGPKPEQAGSLLELTVGGKQAITLGNGERRTFLEDGDSITLRGRCTRTGFQSIGFGECTATVLPPLGAI
ncbi:fumarylacetoacetase [Hydrogenophaga sp. D2P1]|uniref:fumarylacetoacetase n=1 Tax=Hydrogenophaga aromaticivorans TaxID=2610898 RepID=A0A7Y8H0H8_9BURK|nr:fumarylacetoacetase [Hydrogenophaga aromaticivorans]NWF48246.1 fumarylacetoacetase [Hydrogenophaga aromaticivorans]